MSSRVSSSRCRGQMGVRVVLAGVGVLLLLSSPLHTDADSSAAAADDANFALLNDAHSSSVNRDNINTKPDDSDGRNANKHAGRGKLHLSSTSIPVLTTSTEAPYVEVTTDNNVTQMNVICRSSSRFLSHPHLPSLHHHPQLPPNQDLYYEYDDDTNDQEEEKRKLPQEASDDALNSSDLDPRVANAYTTSTLVRSFSKRRGIEVDLGQLGDNGGSQLVVDVEGCGKVAVSGGLPTWARGITFAIKGTLLLKTGWWTGGSNLKEMWMRVSDGMGRHVGTGVMGDLCTALPPTLETLDVSNSLVEELVLHENCAPPNLQRLEVAHAALRYMALCTPSLTSLHISGNELSGDLGALRACEGESSDSAGVPGSSTPAGTTCEGTKGNLRTWEACEGGVAGVQYLHADNIQLLSASTCGWRGLRNLDLRHNLLTSLDLTSCPPDNLTVLTAAHNYLQEPPALPPTLSLLDISYNRLTYLPVFTSAVSEAYLSYNKIGEVGKSRFKQARKLRHLDLSHNNLTKIHQRDFFGLLSLRTLDLSHNRLRHIAPSALLQMPHLRRLHLQRNHLTMLDPRDLAALKDRTHTSLQGNRWTCKCNILSALQLLQNACSKCHHSAVGLQCWERNTQVAAEVVIQSCIRMAHEVTQRLNDESDEDLSEEEGDDLASKTESSIGSQVVKVVPGLVVLILVAIVVVLSYRLYHRHRRSINNTLGSFCGLCGGSCAPTTMNNNHTTNHLRQDQLSQVDNDDSDTETEL